MIHLITYNANCGENILKARKPTHSIQYCRPETEIVQALVDRTNTKFEKSVTVDTIASLLLLAFPERGSLRVHGEL